LDELRKALELATEEELRQLTQILFCRKFNPLDYLKTPEPIEIQSQDWDSWLDTLEERFRYLAADGLTVLKGKTQQVSYRQALIQVCRYLKIPYAQQMETMDIEAEIFLHLVGKAWQKLPDGEKKSLTEKVQRAIAKSPQDQPLPLQIQHDPLSLLLRGGGTLAVSSVLKSWILKHIAQQFAIHFASYQVAKTALVRGGVNAAAEFSSQLAISTARRGMVMSAARYGAVRTVFAVVGPMLWTLFFADLGWRAIATNYGRIIPAIFAVAQIRLTRGEYWQTVG
jgi:uncharacterized protein YaaW (UPF0174 family)